MDDKFTTHDTIKIASVAKALETLGAVIAARADAETKAWDALARYKFWMFGYHAGRWVNYNRLLPKNERRPSPFKAAVQLARNILKDKEKTACTEH